MLRSTPPRNSHNLKHIHTLVSRPIVSYSKQAPYSHLEKHTGVYLLKANLRRNRTVPSAIGGQNEA
jgi:hypothetical protein